jgi:hypothetical protein
MINLSVIIPGIRPENWVAIYHQLNDSISPFNFELICVGPNLPPNELTEYKNFKYIKDFGTPSRCLQIGSEFVEGEFLCWVPDDAIIEKSALYESLEFMYKNSNENDGMCLLYSEGVDYTGDQHLTPEYWVGVTHRDQRHAQVNPSWKIAPVFLYRKKLFDELGGLDCRFEHVNMNTHDLAYRVQHLGGTIHMSPRKILGVSWVENQKVITEAYYENDSPLFAELYNKPEFPRVIIDKNNWKESPSIWERRFNKI